MMKGADVMARKDDYIPVNDEDVKSWIGNLESYVMAHLDELGLAPQQVAFLAGERAEFVNALANHQRQQRLATAAVLRKKTARTTVEAHLRPLVRFINTQPQVTDEMRGYMGLKAINRERMRHEVGREVPGLYLEVASNTVIVHFGTAPGNEHRNGKPKWALGCNIYARKAGDEDFRMLDFASSSPYLYQVHGEGAIMTFVVQYRGQKNRDKGAHSLQQTVAVIGLQLGEKAA
jgi:hypothetical protein